MFPVSALSGQKQEPKTGQLSNNKQLKVILSEIQNTYRI